MLDGTTESPQEVPHKSRRTLMSQQECEIARCSPNHLEMMTNPLHWLQSNAPFPIIQENWLGFLWATLVSSGDTRLKSTGTSISAQEFDESSMHPISSQEESCSQDSIEHVGQI